MIVLSYKPKYNTLDANCCERHSEARSAKRATWLDRMFVTLMRDEAFRVQALRFIDVMPALDDDAELVRHFHEYFDAIRCRYPARCNKD